MTKSTQRRALLIGLGAVGALAVSFAGAWLAITLNAPSEIDMKVNGVPLKDIAASEAALPKCGELFVPGQVIDDTRVRLGCRDAAGGIFFVGSGPCIDGRRLYGLDPSSGAGNGFGFGGGQFVRTTGDVASDAGYGQALRECDGE